MDSEPGSVLQHVAVRGLAVRVGQGETPGSTGTGGAGTRAGGPGSGRAAAAGTVSQGSAATLGCNAAGPWPRWALPQLQRAVAVAGAGRVSALALYRDWFTAAADVPVPLTGPVVGLCRRAHAGSRVRRERDGVAVLERLDAVGRDGWWRTWGPAWRPLHSRADCVRVLLSPRPADLGPLVAAVTAALLDADVPWLLACPVDVRQLRRPGSVVLRVPGADGVRDLLPSLAPHLLAHRPPLCLPLADGAALAVDPGTGMTFGEHRCHLIALALGLPGADRDPLAAIARTFAAHGVDPAAPWR